MKQIDLNKYKEFVLELASKESKDLTSFHDRIDNIDENYDFTSDLHGPNINVPLLIAGAMGLGSETGELQEIVKKIIFQGKPVTTENVFHMKRELGDIIWYWTNACNALGLDPNEVIAENVRKLEARYPGGRFDVHYSENRKEGDL